MMGGKENKYHLHHLVPGFPDNHSSDIISQMSAWTTDTTHDLKSAVGGGVLFGEANNKCSIQHGASQGASFHCN